MANNTGKTIKDVEVYIPSCRKTGTIKAGTKVKCFVVGNNVSWYVASNKSAPFMDAWDFKHHYVTVPADAVLKG